MGVGRHQYFWKGYGAWKGIQKTQVNMTTFAEILAIKKTAEKGVTAMVISGE